MDEHTRTLLNELTELWLAFDPIAQELLVLVARMFATHEADLTGLPNYRRSVEERYGKKE